MSAPRSLRSLLAAWMPRAALGRQTLAPDEVTAALGAAWEKAVGADVARRSRPSKFHHGVLSVLTASSAWSDELSFYAPRIMETLRHAVPEAKVTRLRFIVATGRTRALLDGERRMQRVAAKSLPPTPPATATTAGPKDHSFTDALPLAAVEEIAKQQAALNAARDRAGWMTCAQCGYRFPPQARATALCAVCAYGRVAARRAAIERALMHAPWLSFEELRQALPGATAQSYERTKARLLARWQAACESAQRRLRRAATTAEDRVVAWSYCMLVAGKPQGDIGRAVVEGTLGRDWTHVLFSEGPLQKREAARSRHENQKS